MGLIMNVAGVKMPDYGAILQLIKVAGVTKVTGVNSDKELSFATEPTPREKQIAEAIIHESWPSPEELE